MPGTIGEIDRVTDGATITFGGVADCRIKYACTGATELHVNGLRSNVAVSGVALFGASAWCVVRGGAVNPVAGQFLAEDPDLPGPSPSASLATCRGSPGWWTTT